MLKTLTPACAGLVVVLLWLSGGSPAGTGRGGRADRGRPGAGVRAHHRRDASRPRPRRWLMAYRTYDFQAFSPLDQITRENVGQLQLAWMRAMDEGDQEIRRWSTTA